MDDLSGGSEGFAWMRSAWVAAPPSREHNLVARLDHRSKKGLGACPGLHWLLVGGMPRRVARARPSDSGQKRMSQTPPNVSGMWLYL